MGDSALSDIDGAGADLGVEGTLERLASVELALDDEGAVPAVPSLHDLKADCLDSVARSEHQNSRRLAASHGTPVTARRVHDALTGDEVAAVDVPPRGLLQGSSRHDMPFYDAGMSSALLVICRNYRPPPYELI